MIRWTQEGSHWLLQVGGPVRAEVWQAASDGPWVIDYLDDAAPDYRSYATLEEAQAQAARWCAPVSQR